MVGGEGIGCSMCGISESADGSCMLKLLVDVIDVLYRRIWKKRDDGGPAGLRCKQQSAADDT